MFYPEAFFVISRSGTMTDSCKDLKGGRGTGFDEAYHD